LSYQLALMELKCGNYKISIQKFKEYLQRYPKDPDAHLNISKAYMFLKEYQLATKHLRVVAEILPEDDTAWDLMAKIYEILNDSEKVNLCKKHILPEIPLKDMDVSIISKKEKIISSDHKNGLLFPLVILDSDFLIKIYVIKQKNILYTFKHAFKLFRFKTSEQNFNLFKEVTNFENEKIIRFIEIIRIGEKELLDFESQLFTRCPQARKIKPEHELEKLWYKDLTLIYILLQQDAKQIILVSDDSGLKQICKELKLSCVIMTFEKFWAYLRYKIRKTFRSFYDMWL